MTPRVLGPSKNGGKLQLPLGKKSKWEEWVWGKDIPWAHLSRKQYWQRDQDFRFQISRRIWRSY